MTKRRTTVLWGLAAFALLGVLGVGAVFGLGFLFKSNLSAPPSLIPQSFADVQKSPGHRAHLGKDKVTCASCHDESDGGFRNLREQACASCHKTEATRTHAGNKQNPTSCLTCHAFGAAPVSGCQSCHAGAQGKRMAIGVHMSGKAECKTCHNPHRDPPVVQADCATCHKDTSATHGGMHVSTDAKKREGHVDAKFGTAPATGTCVDCHAPHTPAVAARETCKGCHEAAPQEKRPSGHPACITCHAPHEFTRHEAKQCVTCHQDRRTAITASHATCKGCHTPHATRTAAGACTSCHEHKPTLGAPKVAQHGACTSCHNPHDPTSSPGAACATCHTTTAVKHAPGRGSFCTDCHKVHPKRNVLASTTPKLAVACSSCHAKAPTDVSRHGKGLTCVGCHTPHSFAIGEQKGAFCAKCHASETKIAQASRGHKECAKCHGDVHAPTKPLCATCHATESQTAPAGHRACQNCHEPHDGRVKASAASCTTCHARQGATKHGHVQGGCATCHRPHGSDVSGRPPGPASPPACTTCHSPSSLPGLHKGSLAQPSAHAACTTCHTSHGPPRADRATCTGCHESRKTHQPAAEKCNGCHIFRKP